MTLLDSDKGNPLTEIVAEHFDKVKGDIGVSPITHEEKQTFLELMESAKNNITSCTRSQELVNTETLLSVIEGVCQAAIQQEILSKTDLLTQIPNRLLYEETGKTMLARLNRNDIGSAALFFIDVVKFKDFNTNYGHNVGDEALIEIANNLKLSVRDTDFIARIAGDEFIVLAEHKDENHDFSSIRKSIYEHFKTAHINHDGKDIPLAVSVGIADLVKNDNLGAAQERADRDMYTEKSIQHRLLVEATKEPPEPT